MVRARRRTLKSELLRRKIACDDAEAEDLIKTGGVLAGGAVATNPDRMVLPGDSITLRPPRPRFVSRGGEKLEHGLDTFKVDPSGQVCADVGASTGGFTDCLLQRGAKRVYAIDVGKGQLDSRIASDVRVDVMDGVNIRYLEPNALDVAPTLVVVDLSFIGLGKVAPSLISLADAEAKIVTLIKPQFEARRGEVERGGIVTSRDVHESVLRNVTCELDEAGLVLHGLSPSPIRGRSGNIEFLALWCPRSISRAQIDADALISHSIDAAHGAHGPSQSDK